MGGAYKEGRRRSGPLPAVREQDGAIGPVLFAGGRRSLPRAGGMLSTVTLHGGGKMTKRGVLVAGRAQDRKHASTPSELSKKHHRHKHEGRDA